MSTTRRREFMALAAGAALGGGAVMAQQEEEYEFNIEIHDRRSFTVSSPDMCGPVRLEVDTEFFLEHPDCAPAIDTIKEYYNEVCLPFTVDFDQLEPIGATDRIYTGTTILDPEGGVLGQVGPSPEQRDQWYDVIDQQRLANCEDDDSNDTDDPSDNADRLAFITSDDPDLEDVFQQYEFTVAEGDVERDQDGYTHPDTGGGVRGTSNITIDGNQVEGESGNGSGDSFWLSPEGEWSLQSISMDDTVWVELNQTPVDPADLPGIEDDIDPGNGDDSNGDDPNGDDPNGNTNGNSNGNNDDPNGNDNDGNDNGDSNGSDDPDGSDDNTADQLNGFGIGAAITAIGGILGTKRYLSRRDSEDE